MIKARLTYGPCLFPCIVHCCSDSGMLLTNTCLLGCVTVIRASKNPLVELFASIYDVAIVHLWYEHLLQLFELWEYHSRCVEDV